MFTKILALKLHIFDFQKKGHKYCVAISHKYFNGQAAEDQILIIDNKGIQNSYLDTFSMTIDILRVKDRSLKMIKIRKKSINS